MGWIANIVILVGRYMLGGKWRHSFLVCAVGEAMWAVRAISIRQWDLVFVTSVFVLIALWNWHRWGIAEKVINGKSP